ncbi:flagellar protein FlaG [Virgibacillus halotolerans]|uniref:flagellar protein FlaG n=1 Tax=Virgibacillus halotolerans TaxID=1071053 RepID=UPI0019616D07|nr:flagellar protein FlaG [Virgibacillus halotolerans]MBM7600542.1 flagellar protein FlaG [Virgibacillus halotolerans]
MEIEKVMNGSQPLQSSEPNKQMTIATDNQALHKDMILHKDRVITQKEVETAVSKLNQMIEPLRTDLKFKYHEKLNEYYVTVVNPLTSEVIKEIPPEKMLDMYAEMAELMGILIDRKI